MPYLPNEVWNEVCRYLGNPDLASVCLTERTLSPLAARILYRSIKFTWTYRHGIHRKFIIAFSTPGHTYLGLIRYITIIKDCSDYHPEFYLFDPVAVDLTTDFLIQIFRIVIPTLIGISTELDLFSEPFAKYFAQQRMHMNIRYLAAEIPHCGFLVDHLPSFSLLTTLRIGYICPLNVDYLIDIFRACRQTLRSLHLTFYAMGTMALEGSKVITKHIESYATTGPVLTTLFQSLYVDVDANLGPSPRIEEITLVHLDVFRDLNLDWGRLFKIERFKKFQIAMNPYGETNGQPFNNIVGQYVSRMRNLTTLRLDRVFSTKQLNATLKKIVALQHLHICLLGNIRLPSASALRQHKSSLKYLWISHLLNLNDGFDELYTEDDEPVTATDIRDCCNLEQLAISFGPPVGLLVLPVVSISG
ncbi:hypothetical protein H072_1796 [Dactylellina haptotyla CBS 200.50]|uniref:F-box domain-containing protein n=1 Tax=Dactylellina haptotyla (strain CBS 200.50) TaxID=1284197 RepID=S8AMT8_DACHA|nr:hypothetical protein H072_1796 [Dactylellina haptotyla CBS 200.50]